MSNVIRLLESLATMSRAPTEADYLDLLDGLAPEVREALLRRDARQLTSLLGGHVTMACVIFTPDENEEQAPQDAPDGPTHPADEPESDAESRAA